MLSGVLEMTSRVGNTGYACQEAQPEKEKHMGTYKQLLIDDLPLFRVSDPDTSEAAAKDVKLRRGSQCAVLLEEYFTNRLGLTDEEAGVKSGLASKRSCYWKRCSDLRRMGYIVDTGIRRQQSTGSKGMVCVLTQKGLDWFRNEVANG
jgi:hypothetical protein